jgi:hypothetical protein
LSLSRVVAFRTCNRRLFRAAEVLGTVLVDKVVAESDIAELVHRAGLPQYAPVVGVVEEEFRSPRQPAGEREPSDRTPVDFLAYRVQTLRRTETTMPSTTALSPSMMS